LSPLRLYNRFFSSDKDFAAFIKSIAGFTPAKLKLYKQAFQHRSLFNDAKDNNERLELLGDSILDAIVCEHLFKKFPYKEEGFITELRAKVVNRKSLNEVGQRLGLVDKLQYNRKGMTEISKDLAGNTFEALVGAIYLDMGFDATKKFIQKRILQNLVDVEALTQTNTDYKSQVYHFVQREGKQIEFKLASEKNKNRRSYFVINLEIDGDFISTGEGFSKKAAEQNAAMNAIQKLGIVPEVG
jgi:ribonuclease-3